MSLSISLGWWLAPALVTLISVIWFFWATNSRDGYAMIGDVVMAALAFLTALIVTLTAWLIWALLR